MVTTGDGELGFGSGELAWEMANTSKEGSRRVNCSLRTSRGSNDKYQCRPSFTGGGNWNGHKVKRSARNDWRESLVPAAAVIPAPRVYTKVVAVKKLVVEWKGGGALAKKARGPGDQGLAWRLVKTGRQEEAWTPRL